MAAVLRRAVAQRFASSSSPAAFGLRRFLQEQPAFRPAVPPDRFMSVADRVRGLGVGLAFPRINLDGLVPPAAPARREADAAWELPAASLTVEEARKVLRATQMEAARARIRASRSGAVPYYEFLRLCCDAAGPDAGPSVARALDESGSVIVLGKTVFLRPDMEKIERKGRCSRTIVRDVDTQSLGNFTPLQDGSFSSLKTRTKKKTF